MRDWRFIFEKYLLRKHPPLEPQVWTELSRIRGGLFVDVGAYLGTYSVRLSPHFRQVYAFEPNPSMYGILSENKRLNDLSNLTAEPLALSNQEG